MRKAKTVQKLTYLAPEVVTKVIPTPTEGWDAISPLASMDPKRAPILDNWVPRPGYCEIRGGYIEWADTGTTDPVETLMVYRSASVERMFAAAGTSIYDVTTGGAAGAAVVTGLTSARWQYVIFTPGGGSTVIQLCNGADTLRQYNGTVWSAPAITGLPGGATTANIVNIWAAKRRLWYVLEDTQIAAFMPADAITGAIAGTVDLGALWTQGGYLMAVSSWTIDGGNGPQDYTLFISSRGQVSIYQGTDPTLASSWHLVGTFQVAPPIGRRCTLKVGSDVGIITEHGVLPISQALPFDPSADRSVAITARIQNAMASASTLAKDNFGWQLISFPEQTLAILNVPLVQNVTQQQFVMNALTGAWCRFTGWNANCFEIFNNSLYWGSNDGKIHQGYTGSTDGGSPINYDMQVAFNWFDEPGRIKRMTMVMPMLVLGGSITPTLTVDTNFQSSNNAAPVTTFTGTTLWDSAVWDTDEWPELTTTFTEWLTVNAIGHSMAVRLKLSLNTSDVTNPNLPVLQVNAFNSIIEYGGPI